MESDIQNVDYKLDGDIKQGILLNITDGFANILRLWHIDYPTDIVRESDIVTFY